MSYDEVVISTITLARDPNESRLIRRGLSILSTKPVSTIVVVDGGSGDRFLEDVGRIPKVLLAQSRVPGLLAQVRTSLHRAQETGARYIFYTEPNKEQLWTQ